MGEIERKKKRKKRKESDEDKEDEERECMVRVHTIDGENTYKGEPVGNRITFPTILPIRKQVVETTQFPKSPSQIVVCCPTKRRMYY